METNRIKGKIAFISGASSGIGKAVAEKLAQMGANLILCARSADVLAELKAKIEKEHAVEVITLAFDVRNYQEVEKNILQLMRDSPLATPVLQPTMMVSSVIVSQISAVMS